MKKFARVLVAIVVTFLLVSVIIQPAWAIDDPTDTSIQSAKVYQNIFEDGDWIFFIRYDVNYASDPDEPASETFVVVLYEPDGTTLLYQRALSYYGLNITSIYLTPVQGAELAWGSEYVIKVRGNPSIFGELTEGVNMATRALSPLNDYTTGSMATSRGLFGQHCIDTARDVLGPDWEVTLVTDSDKLNTQGALTFNEAVPGLSIACPSIYSTAVASPELDEAERTVTLKGAITGTFTADEVVTGATTGATGDFIGGSQAAAEIKLTHSGIDMFKVGETANGGTSGAYIVISEVIVGELEDTARERTGSRLRNAMSGLGAWLGISGTAAGGLAIAILFATTAGYIFVATGNVHGSILVSIPVVLLGNFMGLVSFALTWMLVIIVALLFAILFIMGRLA